MVARCSKVRVCWACGGRLTLQNSHMSCADCGITLTGNWRDYDDSLELLIGEERERQNWQQRLREYLDDEREMRAMNRTSSMSRTEMKKELESAKKRQFHHHLWAFLAQYAGRNPAFLLCDERCTIKMSEIIAGVDRVAEAEGQEYNTEAMVKNIQRAASAHLLDNRGEDGYSLEPYLGYMMLRRYMSHPDPRKPDPEFAAELDEISVDRYSKPYSRDSKTVRESKAPVPDFLQQNKNWDGAANTQDSSIETGTSPVPEEETNVNEVNKPAAPADSQPVYMPIKPTLATVQQMANMLYRVRNDNLTIRPDSQEQAWVDDLLAAFDLFVEEVSKRSIPGKRLLAEYPGLDTYAIAKVAQERADAAKAVPVATTPTPAPVAAKRASPRGPVHKGLRDKVIEVLSSGGPVTYHSVRTSERLKDWNNDHRVVSNAISSLVLHKLVTSSKESRHAWHDDVLLTITHAGRKYHEYVKDCEVKEAHKMDTLEWVKNFNRGKVVTPETKKKKEKK